MNRSYVKIFNVQDKTSISLCQYYMNQLPIEMLIDSKRLLYLFKLEDKGCFLISHVFEFSSKKYIEALLSKYDVAIVNNHVSKTALLKILWNKFSIILNVC